jgi:predicted metalloprotease with PDZ domain
MGACSDCGRVWRACAASLGGDVKGRTATLGLVLAAALPLSCGKAEVVQGFPDTFVGVGLELRIEEGAPVVVKALPGGPAAVAGVLTGDRILAIDGESTAGKSLGDVVVRLRGEPETQVQLTMQRAKKRVLVVVRRRAMQKSGAEYAPKH